MSLAGVELLYRLGGPQTEKELPFLSAGNNEWDVLPCWAYSVLKTAGNCASVLSHTFLYSIFITESFSFFPSIMTDRINGYSSLGW